MSDTDWEITDEVRENMKEWMELDKEVAELRKVLRQKNMARKKLSVIIMPYIQHNNINVCMNQEGEKYKYVQSIRQKPITKTFMRDTFVEFFSSIQSQMTEKDPEELATMLEDFISDKRAQQKTTTCDLKPIK